MIHFLRLMGRAGIEIGTVLINSALVGLLILAAGAPHP